MDYLVKLYKVIVSSMQQGSYNMIQVLIMLLICSVFVLFEFAIYRLVSHQCLYSKAFHITITIIPFFMASIIMCLQLNTIVTLGTIGAIAIIRFRTAIKDPVDMMYLLWSIFIGICCGCQLYGMCLMTSLFVTIFLLIINYVSSIGFFARGSFALVINSKKNNKENIETILKKLTKKYRLKSQNITSSSVNFIYEVAIKNSDCLVEELKSIENIEKFSLIQFDEDDII